MIYSGTDLIRTSGQHQARFERLGDKPEPSAVQGVQSTSTELRDDDTKGALLRFARFIKGSTQKKRQGQRHSGNPYLRFQQRLQSQSDKGQLFDIFI